MKIYIVSRKLIKPFTPTPQNLKNYKISLKDELNWSINVGIVIFYKYSKPKIICQLQESLSKILPQFYPLAGRYIKKDYCVDCSDQGVEFVEALALDDVVLTDVLNMGKLEGFLPRRFDRVDGVSDPILSVQITEFIKCGGLAIGVSVSHKIFDAASIGTFVAAWSNANINPKGEIVIVPSFDSPLLFPGRNLSYHAQYEPSRDTIVAKRFLFKKEAILKLRSKLRPSHDINNNAYALSKVRVVCAVVAEALIRIDQTKHRRSRPCLFVQAVNMRHRTIPPLANHSCGNLAMNSVTRCVNVANDFWAQEIAIILGQAIEETVSNCAEILSLGEDGQSRMIIKPEVDLIEKSKNCEVNDVSFSDWSKFGFYEADFGWGKPVLVGVSALPFEKLTVLMDNEDGDGIEAWVHLSTNDMPCFEEDDETKLYTF